MIASDPNVAKVELIAAALGALRERLVLNQTIKGVSDNYCVRAKKYVGDPLVHCSQESNGSGSYFSEVPIQPVVPAVFALKCPPINDFLCSDLAA